MVIVHVTQTLIKDIYSADDTINRVMNVNIACDASKGKMNVNYSADGTSNSRKVWGGQQCSQISEHAKTGQIWLGQKIKYT